MYRYNLLLITNNIFPGDGAQKFGKNRTFFGVGGRGGSTSKSLALPHISSALPNLKVWLQGCRTVNLIEYLISGFCTKPRVINNARHNAKPEQTAFDVEETIQYQCLIGYVTDGFPHAKCLVVDGAASWYGPDITCERKLKF